MQTLTDWQSLSDELNREQRKESRLPLAFPIQIWGFDRGARFFSERTMTSDISASGCHFALKADIESNSVVAIRLLSRSGEHSYPERPLLFEITWVKRQADVSLAGACKLQPEDIWRVAFPGNGREKPATT
jgi:hypothetical protein